MKLPAARQAIRDGRSRPHMSLTQFIRADAFVRFLLHDARLRLAFE